MRKFLLTTAALLAATSIPAAAQDREVPYWASLKSEEVNMRVGPSRDFEIEWVYKRKGMPLKVVRVVDGWRLVRDPDGEEGWVASSLLTLAPQAMVTGEEWAAMRADPADNGTLKWNAEPGVVGALGKCDAGWCEFDVEGRTGWVKQDRLWGAGEP